MKSVAIALAAALFSVPTFAHVRNVYPHADEIMTIKAAIGIATIIQVQDAIQSAIIGDQSGFKVEYMNNAVTIKPLRYGVRTNLYLVTQTRRYNLRLLTGPQEQADFVVYVKDGAAPEHVHWRVFDKAGKAGSSFVHLLRVGRTPQGFILIEGRYSSDDIGTISPSSFWVFQAKNPLVINSLYLSKLEDSSSSPATFSLAVNAADLRERRPLLLEVKGARSVDITIPESVLWQ